MELILLIILVTSFNISTNSYLFKWPSLSKCFLNSSIFGTSLLLLFAIKYIGKTLLNY